MCKYCESKHADGKLYSVLAMGFPKESKRKGFNLVLHRNNCFKLENAREVHSDEGKTISYIKAYHWALGELEQADHVAVEIQYCPFCGEKL